MKAFELMEYLYSLSGTIVENTCDTIKIGDPDRELKKVAVCCIASVDVIKAASQWGADLLITHEPTFYDHMDNLMENDPVTEAKYNLLKESGMTLYRFHDHAHRWTPDMIGEGEFKYLKLPGRYYKARNGQLEVNRFLCDEPITPLELAKKIENELGIKHIRICGNRDIPITKIFAGFGTPNGVFEELKGEDVELVLTGEACECKIDEYARDAAQLGMVKTLMVLGHMGSERDGMRHCADFLKEKFTEFETCYFECGEVYTYTD